MARQTGRIRFFYRKKRYGFIEALDGTEFFFPSSAARDLPKPCEGLMVDFDVVQRDRGLQACNLTVHPEAGPAPGSALMPLPELPTQLIPLLSQPMLSPTVAHQLILGAMPLPYINPLPAAPATPMPIAIPLPISSAGPGASAVGAPTATHVHGRVRFFFRTKGYGFIMTPDGKEYFFHESDTVGMPPSFNDVDVIFDTVAKPGRNEVAVRVRPAPVPSPAPAPATPPPPVLTPQRTPPPPVRRHGPDFRHDQRTPGRSKLGYVRFYYDKKDYGFILGSGGEDYFFARSALEDDDVNGLQGAVVMFETTVGRKGLQACHIRRVAADLSLFPELADPSLAPTASAAASSSTAPPPAPPVPGPATPVASSSSLAAKRMSDFDDGAALRDLTLE